MILENVPSSWDSSNSHHTASDDTSITETTADL